MIQNDGEEEGQKAILSQVENLCEVYLAAMKTLGGEISANAAHDFACMVINAIYLQPIAEILGQARKDAGGDSSDLTEILNKMAPHGGRH